MIKKIVQWDTQISIHVSAKINLWQNKDNNWIYKKTKLPKKFVLSMLELAAFNLDSDLKLSYVPLIASSIK